MDKHRLPSAHKKTKTIAATRTYTSEGKNAAHLLWLEARHDKVIAQQIRELVPQKKPLPASTLALFCELVWILTNLKVDTQCHISGLEFPQINQGTVARFLGV